MDEAPDFRPWRLGDDNAPRNRDEIEACRRYQQKSDEGTTLAQCKCGRWSRGGRCCESCCDGLIEQLATEAATKEKRQ